MGEPFSTLVMRHRGQRICLMGGAKRLEADLSLVKSDVYVSCNGHGSQFLRPDYVVAMDNIHTMLKVPMRDHIRRMTDAPIIGPWHWCDYQFGSWPMYPRLLLTGVVGMWICELMGAHPLIIAGMDGYDGGRGVDQHKDMARHLFCQVRVAGGPITKVWPQYVPGEKRKKYAPPDVFKLHATALEETRVRVRAPIEVRGIKLPVGTVITVPRHEFRLQIKHKSLEEVA